MANDPKRPTGMTTSGSLYDAGEAIAAAVEQGRKPRVGSQEQPVDPSVTPERLVPRGAPTRPYPPLESYTGTKLAAPTEDEAQNMTMRAVLDNLVQQAEAEEPQPAGHEGDGEAAMTYEESVKAFGVITAASQYGGPGQGERVPFRRPVTASEMAAKQDEAAATRRAIGEVTKESAKAYRESWGITDDRRFKGAGETAEERIRREGASSQPLVFHPFERTERIVSMIETQAGRIYVATERGVYRLEGDRLVPLQFDRLPDAT